jgi:hypothetical protein
MDIIAFALFVLLYFVLLVLSIRIPTFGAINIPITLMVMILAWDGITINIATSSLITQATIMSQQELAFFTSIQVIIQALILAYKLRV